jgi:hypothetical protein
MRSGNALELYPERPRFTGIPEIQANTRILCLSSSRSWRHSTHHSATSDAFILCYFMTRSRYSDWLRAGRLRGRSSSPGRVKNFLFSTSSRPALGPTHWVPGALFPGVRWPGVKLTTHLHLVPRSRKCESIHPLPHTPSWRSA